VIVNGYKLIAIIQVRSEPGPELTSDAYTYRKTHSYMYAGYTA